jgi:hypothetical protein
MKKHVFGYTVAKSSTHRTYGGTNYTLHVYDLTSGNVERIGEVSACTAAHKGESSEAWSVVLDKRPNIARILYNRAKAKGDTYLMEKAKNDQGYHLWQYKELGVELHEL